MNRNPADRNRLDVSTAGITWAATLRLSHQAAALSESDRTSALKLRSV